MIEFAAPSEHGRRFTGQRRVRLGDVGVDGILRPDGLARYLQDVAGDDSTESGVGDDDTWVVRRTAVRVVDARRWPALHDEVSLTTWCSGTGAAWAERRTDVAVQGIAVLQAAALWVPIDQTGRPLRLRQRFFDVYGDAAQGRKVPGRVALSTPDSDSQSRPWPIRRADLDVLGHVNNAAVWSAVSEVTGASLRYASLVHHGALEGNDRVTLATGRSRLWLLVDGNVRVSGEFDGG